MKVCSKACFTLISSHTIEVSNYKFCIWILILTYKMFTKILFIFILNFILARVVVTPGKWAKDWNTHMVHHMVPCLHKVTHRQNHRRTWTKTTTPSAALIRENKYFVVSSRPLLPWNSQNSLAHDLKRLKCNGLLGTDSRMLPNFDDLCPSMFWTVWFIWHKYK